MTDFERLITIMAEMRYEMKAATESNNSNLRYFKKILDHTARAGGIDGFPPLGVEKMKTRLEPCVTCEAVVSL